MNKLEIEIRLKQMIENQNIHKDTSNIRNEILEKFKKVNNENNTIIKPINEEEEKFMIKNDFYHKIEILTEKGVLTQKQENFLKIFSEKNNFFNEVLISLIIDPRNFSFEEIENLIKNNKDFYENIKNSNDYIDKNFDFEYLQKIYKENPEIFLKNYNYYVSFKQRIHEFLSEYDKQERDSRKAGGVNILLSEKEKNFLIRNYGITKEELRDFSTTLNTKGKKDLGNMIFKKVLFNSILEKIDTYSGTVYRGLNFQNEYDFNNFLTKPSLNHTNQNFAEKLNWAKCYADGNTLHQKGDFKVIIEVETKKAKTINGYDFGEKHIWFPYGTEFEFLEEIDTDFGKVLRFKTK